MNAPVRSGGSASESLSVSTAQQQRINTQWEMTHPAVTKVPSSTSGAPSFAPGFPPSAPMVTPVVNPTAVWQSQGPLPSASQAPTAYPSYPGLVGATPGYQPGYQPGYSTDSPGVPFSQYYGQLPQNPQAINNASPYQQVTSPYWPVVGTYAGYPFAPTPNTFQPGLVPLPPVQGLTPSSPYEPEPRSNFASGQPLAPPQAIERNPLSDTTNTSTLQEQDEAYQSDATGEFPALKLRLPEADLDKLPAS